MLTITTRRTHKNLSMLMNSYFKVLSLLKGVEVDIGFFITPGAINLAVTDYQSFSNSRVEVKGNVS